ncbi:MAG: polyprenyl synthetase family protein [Bdellovibrionales bacterium]
MGHTNTALKKQEQEVNTSPLEHLMATLGDDMKAVNETIMSEMQSDVPLIPQLAGYLIASGGKRIRPLLTLATTRLIDTDIDQATILAATVEFIHTATLLHDDVVDESLERRGQKAANLVFGNQETVLVGDFLFSRAFQLMVRTDSIEILRILSEASAVIAEGEVLQLQYQGSLSIDWNTYKKIIGAKTASLFAAACEVSGAIAKNKKVQAYLKAYGFNLGIAFQITDDTLDYDANQEELGKSLGDDFREGKITAPILFALEQASKDEKEFWNRTLVEQDINEGDFEKAQELINKYDTLEQSKDLARGYAQKAIDAIDTLLESETDIDVDQELAQTLKALPTYIISRLS